MPQSHNKGIGQESWRITMVNYIKRLWQQYREPNMTCIVISLVTGLVNILAGFDSDYSLVPKWFSFTLGVVLLALAAVECWELRIIRKLKEFQ